MDDYNIILRRSFGLLCLLPVFAMSCQGSPEMRREDVLHGVVERWGEGSATHDRDVVLQIYSSVQDSRMCTMNEELCDAIIRKIAAKPELLKQFFAFFRQQQQIDSLPNSAGSDLYLVTVTDNIFRMHGESSKRVVWLLLLASMFDKPEWIVDTNWRNIDVTWRVVYDWIMNNREYCVYDRRVDCYLLSEADARNRIRVTTDRQKWWSEPSKR